MQVTDIWIAVAHDGCHGEGVVIADIRRKQNPLEPSVGGSCVSRPKVAFL